MILTQQFDVVDILQMLNETYPYLEFIVEDEKKRIGSGIYNCHVFKLKRLNTEIFEKPIKTSLFLKEDDALFEGEYLEMSKQVFESFNHIVPKYK